MTQKESLLAAVKLYEPGRLSPVRTAGPASVPGVEFPRTLGLYKVFPFEAKL